MNKFNDPSPSFVNVLCGIGLVPPVVNGGEWLTLLKSPHDIFCRKQTVDLCKPKAFTWTEMFGYPLIAMAEELGCHL